MSLLDSFITSNRARAEQAYQNASRGSGLNPEYVSTVINQKPKDYVDGTGIAFGSYPLADGVVQKVQWNENTEVWDDFGEPFISASSDDSFFSKKANTITNFQNDEPGSFESFFNAEPTRNLLGYNSVGDGGGGEFYWDPGISKSTHNGGSRIDPDWNNGIWGDVQDNSWFNGDPSNSGNGVWVRPEKEFVSVREFGAIPDGTTDNYIAIQATLDNHRVVAVPHANSPYVISDTLTMNTRTTFKGTNQFWGGNAGTTEIVWDGAEDGLMLQLSREPVGTTTSTAMSAIKVNSILFNGAGIAGIGVYCNYLTNESAVENITVRNCNLFGLLASKMWYAVFRDITARNCAGVGLAFGYNWQGSYSDDNSVNGILLENIRAAQCGQQYNATTAPTGFNETNNPKGGCGIYLNINTNALVANLLGEACYGPGLTVDPSGIGNVMIESVYLEGNSSGAVTDGELSNEVGLYLINNTTSADFTEISGLYFHSSNKRIRLLNDGGSARFRIKNLRQVAVESSNGSSSPIEFVNSENMSIDGNSNQSKTVSNLRITPNGFNTRTISGGSQRDGIISAKTYNQIEGWASGSTVDLFDVRLRTNDGAYRGAFASILLHFNISTVDRANSWVSTHSISYMIDMGAFQRFSNLSASEVFESATQLNQGGFNGGNDLLSNLTPVFSEDVDAGAGHVDVTVQLEPTSSGDQADNIICCSAILLGGAADIGSSPTLGD